MTKKSEYHGLLVLDKPGGISSRAALTRVQSAFPHGTRLGHTGTLDPLATGVLVVCVGKATRLAEYVQRMRKTYSTQILLGATSDSDDIHGNILSVSSAEPAPRDAVAACLQEFVGEIEQVPPVYSAVRIGGRRAYKLARRKENVRLEPRRVQIYSIELMTYGYPQLELRVECGKGTYIRSLARDVGQRLGVGALVKALRRMTVGPFALEGALAIDAASDQVRGQLLPISAAVTDLPSIVLSETDLNRLVHGRGVSISRDGVVPESDVAVFDGAGSFIAIARWDTEHQLLVPVKVFS